MCSGYKTTTTTPNIATVTKATSHSGNGAPFVAMDTLQSFSTETEGFDYEFVPTPDPKYECPICLMILREPYQTKCGHRFCGGCITRWLSDNQTKRCPTDNEPISKDEIFADNFAKREVLSLTVRCPNFKNGCEAIVALGHLEEHEVQCPMAYKPCPLGCASVLFRKDLDNHVTSQCERRVVDCTHCGQKVHAALMQAHDEECPNAKITCDQCGTELTRDKIHSKTDCPKALVNCTFNVWGCPNQCLRSEADSHQKEAATYHLGLLSEAFFKYCLLQGIHPENLTSSRNPGVLSLGSELNRGSFLGGSSETGGARPVGYNVSGLGTHGSRSMSSTGAIVNRGPRPVLSLGALSNPESNSFVSRTQSNPVSVHPEFLNNITYLSRLMENQSIDPVGRVPYQLYASGDARTYHSEPVLHPNQPQGLASTSSVAITDATRTGADQGSAAAVREDVIRFTSERDALGQDKLKPKNAVTPSELTSLKDQNVLQDESLARHDQHILELKSKIIALEHSNKEFKERIHFLEDRLSFYSTIESRACNGQFLWKLKHFSRLRLEAAMGDTTVLHSPPFYTSLYGYKLCVRVNLNGVDAARGTHMSVFIHFMKGEFDDVLDWPFSGKIILSIRDQNLICAHRRHIVETLAAKPNLAAFQRPMTVRNHKGFGYMEFVPLNILDGSSYVLNDTMILRAQVVPDNINSV